MITSVAGSTTSAPSSSSSSIVSFTCTASPAAQTGFTGPNKLNGAIQAPPGSSTYLTVHFQAGTTLDTAFCAQQCLGDAAAGCKFFNAYLGYTNGQIDGTHCAEYTTTYGSPYDTNVGQWQGNSYYSVGCSYGYSLVSGSSSSSVVSSTLSTTTPATSSAKPSSSSMQSTVSSNSQTSSAPSSHTTSTVPSTTSVTFTSKTSVVSSNIQSSATSSTSSAPSISTTPSVSSSSQTWPVPSSSNAPSASDVSSTRTRRHRSKPTPPVQISTMDVVTTEVIYTTVTSCPVSTKTHTKEGRTSVEIITSVSTFMTTDTVTICPKCTATTPSYTPAASTPAAASTTATGTAINTPSNSGSSAVSSPPQQP